MLKPPIRGVPPPPCTTTTTAAPAPPNLAAFCTDTGTLSTGMHSTRHALYRHAFNRPYIQQARMCQRKCDETRRDEMCGTSSRGSAEQQHTFCSSPVLAADPKAPGIKPATRGD